LRVIDANKSENDMLLKDQMDEPSKEHMTILGWKGAEGHVGGDTIKENAFAPRWSERDCSVLV
jgi:hypothetical protein